MTYLKRPVTVGELRNLIADLARQGPPSMVHAAARLGLSRRSLQRQLAGRGLTYSDLVDRTRHEIAASLLRSTRLSITEVSVMLGYRDPSSFSRAFTRWAGCAPRQFRAAQRTGVNGDDELARKGQIAGPDRSTVKPSP